MRRRGAATKARRSIITIGAAALGLVACAEDRSAEAPPPVYDVDVAPILARSCAACHTGEAAAAGWRVTTYLDAVGCVGADGAPAVRPRDPQSPILRVLETASHRDLLDVAARKVISAWVEGGAFPLRGTVHAPGIADPRSTDWHGKLLRDERWRPMLDPNHDHACGRCHEGSPARPSGVTSAAPRATACTTCHDEPGGVLACGTCHGDGKRSFPPRDACFFPDDRSRAGAHAAHTGASASAAGGLPCSACHPTPGDDVMSGLHGNGGVEIIFDEHLVGANPSFDRGTGACAVACHDRGGERARPTWNDDVAMRCGDCHGAPPAQHYRGACDSCHSEVDATGTKLTARMLHGNGRVDLGDGSGTCAACHGAGNSGWPTSAGHPAHAAPAVTTPAACDACHVVPSAVRDPGHLDGIAQVVFSGRAVARGARATWDGRTCQTVACHGAALIDPPPVQPVWTDVSGASRTCDACHSLPPTGHTASGSCDRAECHGSEIVRSGSTLTVSESGKLVHINGVVDGRRP